MRDCLQKLGHHLVHAQRRTTDKSNVWHEVNLWRWRRNDQAGLAAWGVTFNCAGRNKDG